MVLFWFTFFFSARVCAQRSAICFQVQGNLRASVCGQITDDRLLPSRECEEREEAEQKKYWKNSSRINHGLWQSLKSTNNFRLGADWVRVHNYRILPSCHPFQIYSRISSCWQGECSAVHCSEYFKERNEMNWNECGVAASRESSTSVPILERGQLPIDGTGLDTQHPLVLFTIFVFHFCILCPTRFLNFSLVCFYLTHMTIVGLFRFLPLLAGLVHLCKFERIGKSSVRNASLIKPIFGAAGRMGKVAAETPALAANPTLKGSFTANLNATRSWGPKGLGKPNSILKGTLKGTRNGWGGGSWLR